MKNKKDKIWDSFLPFYLQYYWHKNWNDEWSLAWYNGPRIEWMELYESGKIKKRPTN
jgi:hypothetical protein